MNFVKHPRLLSLAGTASLWLTLAGPSALVAADDASTIVVKNFMFMPVSMQVKAGTKVTWTNRDDEPHTIASDNGSFRSSAIDTDESFSYKFDKPGTYHYTCSIHPRMVGTIIVE
jgi:plastocyanin